MSEGRHERAVRLQARAGADGDAGDGVNEPYPETAVPGDTPARAWSFSVKGEPQPKGSTRSFTLPNGRRVTTSDNPAVKTWEDTIRFVLQDWPHGVLAGSVALDMTFTIARPPSVSAKRRAEPTVRPDADKLLRGAQDALKGIVYRDDAQVTEAYVRKVYGETSGLRCEIRWENGSK